MDLKVNDLVVISMDGGIYRSPGKIITKITKVTPTGRLRVEALPSTQFAPNGRGMGDYGYHCPPEILRKATQEDTENARQQAVIHKAKKAIKETSMTYEMAIKILQILSEK